VPLEENLETAQEELDDILHKLFQDINGLNKAIYGEDAGNYRQKCR
jgi:ABC-type transporter Mla subunit MlaD